MERGGRTTTKGDGRERQMETEERGEGRGGRWWVCSSCWGSAVEGLQCTAVQRGGLNQRVPVHPGSRVGCRARDGGGVGEGGGLGVRDDGGSRREAAETGGETAGGRAAKQNTFKKLKDPKVHLWNAPCEERRHANDQIIRGTRLL